MEVWSWGDNSFGQLGQGDEVNRYLLSSCFTFYFVHFRTHPFPISVLTEHRVLKVAAGDNFSMALTADAQVPSLNFIYILIQLL